ncbi:hypothetical protein GCM10011352_36810 [Marinobacterium zhoushanense]|uniref:Uncharacterized protein n=1 Tax=Marinobacterium zhoushanense TaxID=1679163 RepID=A0ABQ1KTQ8_9GAMM|nr:hypothetical protein GCM10011352_36810 [Marinobacterium zhoushanense]
MCFNLDPEQVGALRINDDFLYTGAQRAAGIELRAQVDALAVTRATECLHRLYTERECQPVHSTKG